MRPAETMLFREVAPTTLDSLAAGQTATVVAVDGAGGMAVRLLEMGFVPGTRVKLVKLAPLGDPLELRLRGFHISLRRAEAARIRVDDVV